MAAPTYVQAGSGATDAGGAFSVSGVASAAGGNVLICQVLQDGSTSGAVGATFSGGSENLSGTTSSMTYIGEFPVGSGPDAYQHIWIGRSTATGNIPQIFGTNSTSEDVYVRWYEFTDVNTGTTLADVIENGTAGSVDSSAGTSAAATVPALTTLGADRLGVLCVAVNDDNVIVEPTGETGGDWDYEFGGNLYASASGTDGAIALICAPMASAGTITSTTLSVTDSDAWGSVAFALIGTTAGGPTTHSGAADPQYTFTVDTSGVARARARLVMPPYRPA